MASPVVQDPVASVDGGRARAETLLAGERRLLEMIARGDALGDTLDALCRLVESTEPGSLCSILLFDPKQSRLQHGAGPSLPTAFTSQLGRRPIGPGEGPCAVAAHSRATVIVHDFLDSTVPAWYREGAQSHGLRACWSVPVFSRDGSVLGTFAVYYREPRSPSARELETIDQFRHLASIAIERTSAVDALRRSEASLAEAQRLSRTGSFFWRPATSEIRWSNETYRIYRLNPSQPPDFGYVESVLHPDDLASFRDIVATATRDGTDLAFEHRLLFPDRTVTHLQVVAHAGRDAASGDLEYVGAVMDVSERRRSEDAIHRMQSELAHVSRITTLGQMTASIAHEINQPLAAIVINAKACENWLGGPGPNLTEARDAVRRIVRDGQRAGEVIARLRSLFQRAGGSAAREHLDLDQVVGEVATLCRRDVERHGATLRIESMSVPLVHGDRIQLQQLLLNLIQNGAEAVSEVSGPREVIVTTRIASDAAAAEVVVRDTGVGLAAEQADQVFEAFYTTKPDGMGMGLAIGRSIAEAHGGRLWIERSDGPGAAVVLSLPVSRW